MIEKNKFPPSNLKGIQITHFIPQIKTVTTNKAINLNKIQEFKNTHSANLSKRKPSK